MYASTFAAPFSARGVQGQLYREVGVSTGVAGATPHQLVTMLYDGLLESIRQARGAMKLKQVDLRGRAISRALRIVDEGLKAPLNMAEGGELAQRMSDLYGYISLRLIEANLRNDEQALVECQTLIEPLRDGWQQIAAQVGNHPES